jgi:hypothetical protein
LSCLPIISASTARRFAQRTVVLLTCLSLGMHWAVLQGVAWTGMFLANLNQGTVTEAVEKTFDGEHPCPLCLAVKEGQKKEKDDSKPLAAKSVKKFEAVLVAETRLVAPPAEIRSFPCLVSRFEGRSERPSMPPPRV